MTETRQSRYGRAESSMSCSLVRDWPNVPIDRGEGCRVFGPNGERYLDFCAGMAALPLGHCHPRVVSAIEAQARKLLHGPMGVLLYEPIVHLAERLGEVTPKDLDFFFFGNSGSEAVEGALKLAKYVTKRPVIVSFVGAFHGRTLGALSITTSKAKYRRGYEPFPGGTHQIPYPYCLRCPCGLKPDNCNLKCFDFVQNLFDYRVDPGQVAAFIMEPILGEGGYVPAPVEYVHRLREVCDRHGILLIFDEIQSGFGRTGSMFASTHYGATPDIMAIAKGIASGLPLGATVASKELMSKWPAEAHSTTFGGNPVACAASLALLDVLEEQHVLDNVNRQGERAMKALSEMKAEYPVIGDVRGLGLMIGIEFVDPNDGMKPNGKAVKHVLQECLRHGLILYHAGIEGQVIRFIPPLIVTDSELDEGLRILREAVASI